MHRKHWNSTFLHMKHRMNVSSRLNFFLFVRFLFTRLLITLQFAAALSIAINHFDTHISIHIYICITHTHTHTPYRMYGCLIIHGHTRMMRTITFIQNLYIDTHDTESHQTLYIRSIRVWCVYSFRIPILLTRFPFMLNYFCV